METAFRTLRLSILCIVGLTVVAQSQPLVWEDIRGPLSLPDNSGYELGGAVSDGYGQHVVFNYSGLIGPSRQNVYYYLFDNDGVIVCSTLLHDSGFCQQSRCVHD